MGNNKLSGATTAPEWNAVYAMSLTVSGLIISEFLPVSLLTPIAHELKIAEGVAGQAISVTAIVALVASLLTPSLTHRYNRRNALAVFGLLQITSNLMVGFAGSYMVLLFGRVL